MTARRLGFARHVEWDEHVRAEEIAAAKILAESHRYNWRELHSIVEIPAGSPPTPEEAQLQLVQMLNDKMRHFYDGIRDQIADLIFWQPARAALENGGCRQ